MRFVSSGARLSYQTQAQWQPMTTREADVMVSLLRIADVAALAVGVATETDSALALALRKRLALSSAIETDSALALALRKRLAVALAGETDAALALTLRKRLLVVPINENDSALVLSLRKRLTVGLAVETDEALALVVSGGSVFVLAYALVVDAIQDTIDVPVLVDSIRVPAVQDTLEAAMKAFPESKDPNEVDWRNFDWSSRVPASDSIASATVTRSGPDTALVVDQATPSGLKVSFRWQGGTAGVRYSITCHIDTVAGRSLDWTADVLVRQL
jgi:hypothetical protein